MLVAHVSGPRRLQPICPNSLKRCCCISEETGGWSVCDRTDTLVTCAVYGTLVAPVNIRVRLLTPSTCCTKDVTHFREKVRGTRTWRNLLMFYTVCTCGWVSASQRDEERSWALTHPHTNRREMARRVVSEQRDGFDDL